MKIHLLLLAVLFPIGLLAGCGASDSRAPAVVPAATPHAPLPTVTMSKSSRDLNGQAHVAGYRANFVLSKDPQGNVSAIGLIGSTSVYLGPVHAISFIDKTTSFDASGPEAQVYRLYQAAFNRKPDQPGLGYWIGRVRSGSTLEVISAEFTQSEEYRALYGTDPSALAMATKWYTNVLHRQPEEAGLKFWVDVISAGLPPSQGLLGFSESAENRARLQPILNAGFDYVPYVAGADAPFPVTPPVVPSNAPIYGYAFEGTWKIDFEGDEVGFCQAVTVSQSYSRARTDGMCLSKGKVLGNFELNGVLDSSFGITLNMLPTPEVKVPAIFRGALRSDGTGSGTWSVPGTASKGTWRAARYAPSGKFPVPRLDFPEPGSLAATTDGISGIWSRPSVTNYPSIGLITPTGEISGNLCCIETAFIKLYGKISVQADSWSLASGSMVLSSYTVQAVSGGGDIVRRKQIVGTVQVTSDHPPVVVSFDQYEADNALAVTLRDLAGTYLNGSWINISSDGEVIGATIMTGCLIRGQLSEVVPGSKYNMFRVNISYHGRCEGNGEHYDGIAYLKTTSYGERYMVSMLRPRSMKPGLQSVHYTAYQVSFGGLLL